MWYVLILVALIILFLIIKKKTPRPVVNQTANVTATQTEDRKKRKHIKSWGEFEVKGTYYLDGSTKIMLKSLEKGGELNLKPDPNNSYDNYAIKVLFNGFRIGWVAKGYHKKQVLLIVA